ncbi:unnamed protein product [Anisakis simplex]|uniref:non-specific serine/threonine protein kinase n=1 Tax=Anisakis simplex TaxID=6269 RepID=A0A0M3KA72_ANISI|nr:unnamed protein product [Anisakis simplex]
MSSSPLVTAKTQISHGGSLALPIGLIRLYPKLSQKNVSKPLCQFGEKIAGKWIISGLIGKGGYGQIYFAYDALSPKSLGVAVKTEPKKRKGRTAKRMILEQKVHQEFSALQILLRLQGRSHAPLMWASGSTSEVNYIVMQLLSINVNDIRKQSPFKRFSRPTMGRIVIQAIAALRDIHQIGYIHRDIKPHNMCFGLSEASKHRLILVDYGLARRFRHSNGRLRPLREQCGFRGTTLYASVRCHDGKDVGPSDDLISLFYSAIEMIRGVLPWRELQQPDDVKLCKIALQCDDFHAVSKKVGEGFRELGRAVTSMDAEDEPNYAALQEIMMEFVDHRKLSDPYDWDNNFQEVYRERDLNRSLNCQPNYHVVMV